MSGVLPAQTIAALCRSIGLVTPFEMETQHETGLSFGLGAASYSVRIAQNMVLPPLSFRLSSTVESFNMPNDICASVMNKSTTARFAISGDFTHIDPGFRGGLTLELGNRHPREYVRLQAGQPIAQIKFERLEGPTTQPYKGKYQNQPKDPVGPIFVGGARPLSVVGLYRHYRTKDVYQLLQIRRSEQFWKEGDSTPYGIACSSLYPGEDVVTYQKVEAIEGDGPRMALVGTRWVRSSQDFFGLNPGGTERFKWVES